MMVASSTGWSAALRECYRRKQAVQQSAPAVTLLRFGVFLLAIALYLVI